MMRPRLLRAAVPLLIVGCWPLVRADELPVRVPIVVTDAQGASIRGLGPDDIEILENGEAQKIAALTFEGATARHITVVLDEYHVTPGAAAERARKVVAAFIAQHVRPQDVLRVVRPPARFDTAPMAHPEALALVAAFAGRKGDYDSRSDFETEYMRSAPAFAARQRAQIVRASLVAAATALRLVEGSKALVVVTEGFAHPEPSGPRTTNLRAIARAARLADIPVYVLDPSAAPEGSRLDESWRSVALQTGGRILAAGSEVNAAAATIGADLDARYVAAFEPSRRAHGSFHPAEVRVKRKGAFVHAPSGYWTPVSSAALGPPPRPTDHLLTPHSSGLIQPWFRMAPAPGGRTRVTFSWMPTTAADSAPVRIALEAVTFEGQKLHASSVMPLSAGGGAPMEASFEAAPGPIQVAMGIESRQGRVLDTDVRYITVPTLTGEEPIIAAVEFLRPRSLPEFTAMQRDPRVMPTEARDFLRQDRLLVRVRAFAASATPEVSARLLNRRGQTLLVLPALSRVEGVAQFELPFARYARGDYQLEVRAAAGGKIVKQMLPIRITG